MWTPEDALVRWGASGEVWPAPDAGLINGTWFVGRPPSLVLQWVNPVFRPEVHLDIEAVTARLAHRGVVTPRLVPTRTGELWAPDPERGCWRVSSFIAGRTVHRVRDPAMAAEAGSIAGRFHAALAGWAHSWASPRRFAHDTPAKMAALGRALEKADGHALEGPCRALGAEILDRWSRWEGELEEGERTCHGDLKVSNVRFDEAGRRARCLIDLDTVGPMALSCELGDAWRSWCNPAGEDELGAVVFDVDLFAASAGGFLDSGPALSTAERDALVPGIERICLELAARFCADAVDNSYFREDRARWPAAGTHNLHRARVQATLARSARDQRGACERIVRGIGGGEGRRARPE